MKLLGGGENYDQLLSSLSQVIADARGASVRAVNMYLTSAYWLIGRHIVEYEQGGEARAPYGDALLTRLARDLTPPWGRGFSQRNLALMRSFYQTWPIMQTPSAQSLSSSEILQTVSAKSVSTFPLPWSHYVRLLSVANLEARKFYEREALRGGWSVRQLDRQIGTRAYERGAGRSPSSALLFPRTSTCAARLCSSSELKGRVL